VICQVSQIKWNSTKLFCCRRLHFQQVAYVIRRWKKSFKESNIDIVRRSSKQLLHESYRKLFKRTCVNLRLRKLLNKTLVNILDVGSYFFFSINSCNFDVLEVGSYFLKAL